MFEGGVVTELAEVCEVCLRGIDGLLLETAVDATIRLVELEPFSLLPGD